jgi:hypothetical protein
LWGDAGIWWNGAAVDGGEQAINSVESAEALQVELHQGRNGACADGQNLQFVAVSERNHSMGALFIDCLVCPFKPIGLVAGLNENRRRGGQDDDAGVILRQPEDRVGLGFERWIGREIATSNADGFLP